MKSILVNASVVVVAQQFNPSIINQIWLVDNSIVERSEFRPGCVFSDMMVNVASERFALLVTPDQVQFAPVAGDANNQELLVERFGRLIQTLPHTPYTACGLNFTWLVEDDELVARARDLFFVGNSPLHQAFDLPESRFGGYLSRPALDGRMKLDVKPLVFGLPEGGSSERLQFAFNLHFDIKPDRHAAELIVSHLRKWNEAHDEAENIMKLLEHQFA